MTLAKNLDFLTPPLPLVSIFMQPFLLAFLSWFAFSLPPFPLHCGRLKRMLFDSKHHHMQHNYLYDICSYDIEDTEDIAGSIRSSVTLRALGFVICFPSQGANFIFPSHLGFEESSEYPQHLIQLKSIFLLSSRPF